jgi:hypothetical protein
MDLPLLMREKGVFRMAIFTAFYAIYVSTVGLLRV